MPSQKEAPIYLQVRRSNLENIGIVITNPFDFSQVVPYVTGFINSVRNQYFKPSVKTTTHSYDYINPNNECPNQTIKLYYELDELFVAGASPFAPVLYSGTGGLLAGTQEFAGFEQSLGCYNLGSAPLDPKNFKILFTPYSEQDPSTKEYIVRSLMTGNNSIAATVKKAPGYDGIGFSPDAPIDDQNPAATASGVFYFRIYPIIKIELKN